MVERSKTVIDYEKNVIEVLNRNLGLISTRQKSMKIEDDTYSPVPDIIIGPTSFEKGNRNEEYKELLQKRKIKKLIKLLKGKALNADQFSPEVNENPRVFIGIECENSTAKDAKHMLGSITNLSLMSKVGILVVYDHGKETLERIEKYLTFVERKEKIKHVDAFKNVFLITKSNFDDILDKWENGRSLTE